MRAALVTFASLLALAACSPDPAPEPEAPASDPAPEAAPGPSAPVYPETRTTDQRDTYQSASLGEVAIADPYRWLEADVRVSDDVAGWVSAQQDVTNAYLEALPGRARIAERLSELWNYERYGLPTERGGRYFFTRNDGLQNQSVLVVQEGLDGEAQALIDPNAWSEDGTTALAGSVASPDGSRVAYLIQEGGSDWRTIRVIDVDSGAQLEDQVRWVKFSPLSWASDGSGFFLFALSRAGGGGGIHLSEHEPGHIFPRSGN